MFIEVKHLSGNDLKPADYPRLVEICICDPTGLAEWRREGVGLL